MNWEIIEHLCISVAVVGAAITYIYKALKFAKKPSEDVNAKLDRDFKRINMLDEELTYISKAVAMLMRSDLVLLGHMKTGNNTGKIADMEKEIQDFLINN